MLLRVACALLSLFGAQRVLACSIMVRYPPQVLVRSAEAIVEGVAISDAAVEVEKVRKGTAPQTISLADALGNSCYSGERPVEGKRYLVLLDGFQTAAYEIDGKTGRQLLQVLTGPRIVVTRADLLAKLRAWHYGTMHDHVFAEWVHRVTPIANVAENETDDVLHVLDNIDSMLNDSSPENGRCVPILRKQFAPLFIELLAAPAISDARAEELEQEFFALAGEHPDCFP
jgi:hypothetical protein